MRSQLTVVALSILIQCPRLASAAPTGTALCALMSAADLGAALGLHGVTGPTAAGGNPVTRCSYQNGSSMSITLLFQTGVDAAGFGVGRQGVTSSLSVPTADVPGLGDAAFSYGKAYGKLTINAVVMLKGRTQVQITSEAPPEKEISILKALALKL